MASTRNINMPGNYALEQKTNQLFRDITSYKYGPNGQAYRCGIPDGGSAIPSNMSRDSLSYNPVDIETMLRGTGSTNLVNPQTPIKPELKTLPRVTFFERHGVNLPKPLDVPLQQQRTGLYQNNIF